MNREMGKPVAVPAKVVEETKKRHPDPWMSKGWRQGATAQMVSNAVMTGGPRRYATAAARARMQGRVLE